MKYVLSVLLCCFLMLACQSKYDVTQLHGEWKTVQWIQSNSGNSVNNPMNFKFDSDDRYEVDYGSETEEGRYWIAGDYLHTVEDGRAEKKVRIIKLTKDSLEFEMNRAGYLEMVTLVRQN